MALSENEKRRFENRYRGIVDQKNDPFDALPDSVKARLYKRKSTLVTCRPVSASTSIQNLVQVWRRNFATTFPGLRRNTRKKGQRVSGRCPLSVLVYTEQ